MKIIHRERETRHHPELRVQMPGYKLTCDDGTILFQFFHPYGVFPVAIMRPAR
jgi:hypothetical protein